MKRTKKLNATDAGVVVAANLVAKARVIDVDIMLGPIMTAWNAIAGDLDACAAEAGSRITNIDAVEACLDAGRLTMFAYGERGKFAAAAAEAELTRAIDVNGYPKVLRALDRAIRLI